MSGLDQLFGGLPHDPPPFFTRPVTIEGVRKLPTPGSGEVTHPMPAPGRATSYRKEVWANGTCIVHPGDGVGSEGEGGVSVGCGVYSKKPISTVRLPISARSRCAARRPTARPKALGQVRANQPHAQGPCQSTPLMRLGRCQARREASNQPHAQGPLPIDPANAARPMSSSSRASNASNISAQAKATQDTLMILTPRMKADPEVRAALRKIKARAKALEG